jgi:lipoic acid synthetase
MVKRFSYEKEAGSVRKPRWVFPRAVPIAGGHEVRKLLRDLKVSTVCESARCPNRGECFGERTATFLLLGRSCTRRCGFCAVHKGCPEAPDPGEPGAVAEAVRRLGLDFVVVTSVTRDDLPDGGAAVFAEVVGEIRRRNPGACVEVLVPDFGGRAGALERVLAAAPEVLNHNVETVPRLYPAVRPGADYGRSVDLLRRAAEVLPVTKSGMMLGLGEEREEVMEVMRDLARAGCRSLTLGQYLQPTRENLAVSRYLEPREFADLAREGRKTGIERVVAGPLVRSSYHAGEIYAGFVSARDEARPGIAGKL